MTAVEWLANELYEKFEMRGDGILYDEILTKAKEMEKQQIIDAFEVGYENGACVNDVESIYHGHNYYNKTYNKTRNEYSDK